MPWIKSCLCQHQEKRKAPPISPPIHLLKNEDNAVHQGPNHAFRCKTFKKPRPCHLCHQPIFNEGSCCRVCKYVCHKVCESKEAAQRYTDTSWSIHRQLKKEQVPVNNQKIDSANNDAVSLLSSNDESHSSAELSIGNKQENCYESLKIQTDVVVHKHDDDLAKNGTDLGNNKMIPSTSYNGFGEALTSQPRAISRTISTAGIDLSYVTEKIIALWFPPSTNSQTYRQGHRQVAHMLQNKHGDNYMIFNLTEPRRALRNEHKHVKEVGWAQSLAPPLEKLCSVCKEIDSWLSVDKHRIAVLHAKGSKEKLGVIVAAYMHYSSICGSNEQALDRFSMRKFLEENVGPLQVPSNKRYVEYFSGLLSKNIKVNAAPLALTHVTVLGAPSFRPGGGCNAFLKIYEGQEPVYTSGIYNISSGVEQFTVNLASERRKGLNLRGDILIKCYHRTEIGRETIFACQFHTCAVADYTLSFTRQELDVACIDARFPVDGAVELHFSSGLEGRHPAPAPTPAVPLTLSDDTITRADTPFAEEYDEEDSDSDGSIYASISKKPELSPGAVSSPLTVSMDSGISSAGHQQNANTTASASPPLTSQPSPLTPEDQHRELDALLTSMMLTVQSIPDLKPARDLALDSVRFIDDDAADDDERASIPYHARHDSQPFSYGVRDDAMIGPRARLASPSLVRRAAPPAAACAERYEPLRRRRTDGALASPTGAWSDSESLSPPGAFRTKSPEFHETYATAAPTNKNLTWLQKQQLKLKERREVQLREERHPNEMRLMSEMRQVQHARHMRPTASHRLDGYTSDTTAFADDDDDYTIPLHINTRQAMQSKAAQAHERPFMTVKRAYQQNMDLTSNPLGQVVGRPSSHDQTDGLLSLVEQERQSNKSRGFNNNNTSSGSLVGTETSDLLLNNSNINNNNINNDNTQAQLDSSNSNTSSPLRNELRVGALNDLIANLSSGSDKSSNNSPNNTSNAWQTLKYREESSWRSQHEAETSPSHNSSPRPQTPAFPVLARTPYTNPSTPTVQFDLPSERLPPKSPTTQRRLSCPASSKLSKKWSLSPERKDRPTSPTHLTNGDYPHPQRSVSATPPASYYPDTHPRTGSASPTPYFTPTPSSRRASLHSNNDSPTEVSPAHVKFVRDTSRFWYKPQITRDAAVRMLRAQPPGAFVVRDSNSFPGAFGLAVRVAAPGSPAAPDELTRHFLIEPTPRGVRLKGCPAEPVFGSLSALVYQHSVTALALPCRLALPEAELGAGAVAAAELVRAQGAACNVLYLCTLEMEALTGPEAIKKAVRRVLQTVKPETAIVHFKVNGQGITVTDNKRRLFFRRHYAIGAISHCGLDPEEHRWSVAPEDAISTGSANRIFGFIARKPNASTPDNQCHLFAELEPEQPATAIVNFVNKILSTSTVKPNIV